MTPLPPLTENGRIVDAAIVVVCGVGQAAALAFATFATRDAFVALHGGGMPSIATLAEFGMAGLVAAACVQIARVRAEALGQSYAIALRRVIYAHIAGFSKSRHAARRLGAYALRFVGDMSAARLWYGRGLPRAVSAMIVLPGAFLVLWALDARLALAAVPPLIVALIVMAGLAAQLEARHRSLRGKRANLAIAMMERIAVSPELDLLGRTNRELKSLDKTGATVRQNAVARVGRAAALQTVLQVGLAVGAVAILWVSGVEGLPTGTAAAGLSLLALLAMPLQDVGEAWDQFCAWRVARSRAEALLSQPSTPRNPRSRGGPATVDVSGKLNGTDQRLSVASGACITLDGAEAGNLAKAIAGLDRPTGLQVTYNGQKKLPVCAYIGDTHVGLQGSLRRSATLMCRKRPKDDRVAETLAAFGLSEVLERVGGLDGRIGEAGRTLSAAETLRLDLARASLGRAELVVIDSGRWHSMPAAHDLASLLQKRHPTTLILAGRSTADAVVCCGTQTS
ncbi:MAG: hypothetical protein AAFX00_02395 [Pseudomonadota bacterium]